MNLELVPDNVLIKKKCTPIAVMEHEIEKSCNVLRLQVNIFEYITDRVEVQTAAI